MLAKTGATLAASGLAALPLMLLLPALLVAEELPRPDALPPLPAPACQRLTLEQARELALANNKQLLLGRLNVQEKQIAISAASRDYFPKLLGTAAYLHFDQPLGTVLSVKGGRIGGGTVNITGTGPIGAGAVAQLPSVNIPSRTTAVNVVNQDTAVGALIVAQPITKLIAVSALVDIARADEGIAAAQLDKGTRDLLSGVTQAYYGLIAGKQIHAALSLQAEMLEPLLKVKPSAELRLGLLELRKGLAEVEKQLAELTAVLNQLLGLPPCTCLELVEPGLLPVGVTCADEAAQHALTNNPQVREARQNIAKAEAGLRIAKMDYLPDVNVVGGYSGQTAADYIQGDFSFVGVTASYTFWDWGKKKEVKRQRETQIALAHHNVEVMLETVELDARKAFLAYRQAQEDLTIAVEVVKARQEAEKEAKDPVAILAAKSATAKAQLEQMQAELNYRLAHAKLLAAIGQP